MQQHTRTMMQTSGLSVGSTRIHFHSWSYAALALGLSASAVLVCCLAVGPLGQLPKLASVPLGQWPIGPVARWGSGLWTLQVG